MILGRPGGRRKGNPPEEIGPDVRESHAAWERIADSFDRNRTRPWPHVETFLGSLPRGARVLDLMGGNGRHTKSILAAGHEATWFDWSRPAARIVRSRYDVGVVVGDAVHLPFSDASFDAAIYVAGLHGLATRRDRVASLRELARVLHPGGLAQITVWSRDAPRFRSEGVGGQCLDVDLPWRADGHNEARHYHLCTPADLRATAQAAGLEVLVESETSIVSRTGPDNLVIVVRRPAKPPRPS